MTLLIIKGKMDETSKKARSRDAIHKDYLACEAKLRINYPEQRLIYDNQKEVALEMMHSFINENVHLAILIAEMQVGKTGACLATAFYMCMHSDDSEVIDMQNVILLTGLSDTDWKEQTRGSMISSFQDNVYHRGNFKSKQLIEQLKHGQNMLLIIDESHIATQISQQMSILLKETNILNIDNLRSRNIRIMQISATPGATLQDALDWGSSSKLFKLKPSSVYVSFQKLKDANRIKEALDLSKNDNVLYIGNYIKNEYIQPKYHIIRVKGRTSVIKNIERLCTALNWQIIHHNSLERWNADILTKKPNVHTFILIKDFWRASKRLCDIHIGVVHESFVKKIDANTNAQGLAGRCCGNDKQTPGTGTPTIFCSVLAIQQYIDWVAANGNYEKLNNYSSHDINVIQGKVRTQKTLNHHSNILGIEPVKTANKEMYEFPEWTEQNGFASISDIKAFLKEKLKKNVKVNEFYDIEGFKLSTRLTNYYNKTKGQLTCNDRLIYADYKKTMAGTNIAAFDKKGQNYMIYPVYANMESPRELVRYYYSILKTD